MGFANSRTEAVLLLSAALVIGSAFFFGLVTRPVITFTLSTPLDYNGTIDFESGDILVNLETKNEGLSAARVGLGVWLYNMSLTGPNGVETIVRDGFTELRISLDEPIRRSGDYTYPITLKPAGKATYLVLVFSAESQPRWDPMTGFYDSFAIYKPERPTALLLRHVEDEVFMRVRSRTSTK